MPVSKPNKVAMVAEQSANKTDFKSNNNVRLDQSARNTLKDIFEDEKQGNKIGISVMRRNKDKQKSIVFLEYPVIGSQKLR